MRSSRFLNWSPRFVRSKTTIDSWDFRACKGDGIWRITTVPGNGRSVDILIIPADTRFFGRARSDFHLECGLTHAGFDVFLHLRRFNDLSVLIFTGSMLITDNNHSCLRSRLLSRFLSSLDLLRSKSRRHLLRGYQTGVLHVELTILENRATLVLRHAIIVATLFDSIIIGVAWHHLTINTPLINWHILSLWLDLIVITVFWSPDRVVDVWVKARWYADSQFSFTKCQLFTIHVHEGCRTIRQVQNSSTWLSHKVERAHLNVLAVVFSLRNWPNLISHNAYTRMGDFFAVYKLVIIESLQRIII